MGTDASVIVGYLKHYESQVVVKSGGAQEATSHLRTYMMADDGSALYPLKQGAQGEGAISEPLLRRAERPAAVSLGKRCAGCTALPLPETADDPLGIRCHCAEIIAGDRPQKRLCGGIRGQILSGSKRTHLCRGRLSDRGKTAIRRGFLGQCACTVSGGAETVSCGWARQILPYFWCRFAKSERSTPILMTRRAIAAYWRTPALHFPTGAASRPCGTVRRSCRIPARARSGSTRTKTVPSALSTIWTCFPSALDFHGSPSGAFRARDTVPDGRPPQISVCRASATGRMSRLVCSHFHHPLDTGQP